ncbi:MAG: hypothetical protein ACR2K3_09190 [Nocardioides sp.]
MASFTHAVRGGGCDRHIAPIQLVRLTPPKTPDSIGSGPAPERIRTAVHSYGLPGYPRFSDHLGGLPYQGVEPGDPVEGVLYLQHSVNGLTDDRLQKVGGVLVSASHGTDRFQHLVTHLPDSLTRVRVGSSPGRIHQSANWATTPPSVQLSVNWVTADNFFMSVAARRGPRTLVGLARSLAC